jgi:hypothetical protein
MVQNTNSRRAHPQLARVFFPLRANGFLTIDCSWFSRLAIFSKLVAGVIQAFWAVARWRRKGRVIAKGGVVSEHELDAFISFALETLPPRTDSTEEARALLIAEGILTADGELVPEYRPAGDSSKLHE